MKSVNECLTEYKVMMRYLKDAKMGSADFFGEFVVGCYNTACDILNSKITTSGSTTAQKHLTRIKEDKAQLETAFSYLTRLLISLQTAPDDCAISRANLVKVFEMLEKKIQLDSPVFDGLKLKYENDSARRLSRLFEEAKCFKTSLSSLMNDCKEIILDNSFRPEFAIGESSKYLLVNAAEKVQHVFKSSPTISASIMSVENPHWYQEDKRPFLFVYAIKEWDDLIGMFKVDSSTYYSRVGTFGSALLELLLPIDVSADKILGANITGFRPAYSPNELLSDESSISEVVLKGSVKPRALVVTDASKLRSALAYHELFPEVSLWLMCDKHLISLDRKLY